MEETSEVLEVEETADDLSEEDLAAFDEDWDDDPGSDDIEADDGQTDEVAVEEGEADEGTEQEETEPSESSEEEPESGNQRFKINYLGKEEELTLEQMTELAQKGRDYDHVRQERDDLKGKAGKYANADRQLAFLKKLADKSGVSVEDQIDLTEAMWLMDEEAAKGNHLTESEALLRVQKGRGGKPEEPAETGEEPEINPQVQRFLAMYPDVPAAEIPAEVWQRTSELGGDLLSAYQEYEIKQLKAEREKAKLETRNSRNATRSTGARTTAGANQKRDQFDEGWDS